MKVIVFTLGLLLVSPAFAQIQDVTSSECSDRYQFLNTQENETFFVRADTSATSVEWNQDGLTYHLEFSGMTGKHYSNPSSIQLAVWKIDKDGQGRVTHLSGTLNQTMISATDSSSLTQNYESSTEYMDDDKIVQKFIIDGKTLDPIVSTRKKLANGDLEVSRTNKNTDESGEFRLVLTETKCRYKTHAEADLKSLLPRLAMDAVLKFSSSVQVMQPAALWAQLANTKDIQSQVHRSVDMDRRKGEGNISVGKDLQNLRPGQRMWENQRLMRMLDNSPMARFTFCRLGC